MNGFDDFDSGTTAQPNAVGRFFTILGRKYQTLLDVSTPHLTYRWIFTAVVFILFMARVLLLQGWYIVTYALGIYYLNMLIAFLTPKIDPAAYDFEDDEDGPALPTSSNEEFRPFIRRLPEFKFWLSSTKATIISLVCTFFEFCNIPVFWPILLIYFITLFIITMKRQILHMIKYRYLPWTHGKAKYQGKEDTGRVYANTKSTSLFAPMLISTNSASGSSQPAPSFSTASSGVAQAAPPSSSAPLPPYTTPFAAPLVQ